MACGTPVLTSSTSALQEIAGGYAYLVDPMDVRGDRARHRRARDRREDARRLARARASKRALDFSWDKAAEKTLEVYRSGARRRPSAHEDGGRPRLADRNAGRRARPRGDAADRCPSRRSSRSFTSRARCRRRSSAVPIRDVLPRPAALRARALSELPAALPARRRVLRPLGLRPRRLLLPLRRQGGDRAAGSPAPLLLPHAGALRLRAVRRLLPEERHAPVSRSSAASSRGCAPGTSRTADRPTRYLANSSAVADRIRRHYGREARRLSPAGGRRVLHAVGTSRGGDFLLAVGALVPYKRLDLAIDGRADARSTASWSSAGARGGAPAAPGRPLRRIRRRRLPRAAARALPDLRLLRAARRGGLRHRRGRGASPAARRSWRSAAAACATSSATGSMASSTTARRRRPGRRRCGRARERRAVRLH